MYAPAFKAVTVRRFRRLFVIACAALNAFEVDAQVIPLRSDSFVRMHQLTRFLLGETKYFSADMDFDAPETNAVKALNYSVRLTSTPTIYVLEMDARSAKAATIEDERVVAMRRIGVSKQVVMLRADRSSFYHIFPDAHLHVMETLNPETIKASESKMAASKIEKTYLSDENVNGYVCRKYQVTVKGSETAGSGFLWVAPSLENVPVRLELKGGRRELVQNFRNISTNKPAETLFEVPLNSVQKTNVHEMITVAKENWRLRVNDKSKQKR
jgi:hypothetical protein